MIQKERVLISFHTSFEELYPYKNLDSLSDKDFMYSPVLIKTSDEIFIAVTESDLDDYPGMFLREQAGTR
jgi:alpha-glucosidase